MLKQGLELKQTQKLSPLQIQTIKLIELPIQELDITNNGRYYELVILRVYQ